MRDDAVPTAFRSWLIPLVSLVAVLGGGIAAGAIGGSEDPVLGDPVTTTTEATTPTSTPVIEPGDEPDDGDDADASEGTAVERYWGPECGDGPPTNHGQYVSSQQQDGGSRREAAQSPCGKPLQSVTVTTTTQPTVPETDDATDGPVSTSSPSNRGNGNGNGNGNGPPPGRGGPKHS